MTLRGIDDTAVTVEVYEGPGTVDSPSLKQSASLSMSSVTSWNQWVSMKVTLYGVTAPLADRYPLHPVRCVGLSPLVPRQH